MAFSKIFLGFLFTFKKAWNFVDVDIFEDMDNGH
jgi:hypothetical protein